MKPTTAVFHKAVSHRGPFLSTLAIAALSAAPLSAQAVMDTLMRKDGRNKRGVEVQELGLAGIVFTEDGRREEMPAQELSGVQWYLPPEEFNLAAAELARGEFANAAELYREAAGKTTRRPLQVEAMFLAAEALVGASRRDPSRASAAEAALRDFLTANPDNYRVPDATLNLGRAMRLGGRAGESEQTLTAMEASASSGNWGAAWVARARIERALTHLDLDDAAKAREAFKAAATAAEAAIGAGNADPALAGLRIRALVGEGETYVHEDNHAEALRYFRNLARQAGDADPALTAAAKAGEGQALFLQAQASNDIAGLRGAQLALAEANLLDSTGGETSAKSAYFMAMTILALGSGGESETFKARADSYLQIVANHYPDTAWAARAREELDR